MKMIARLLMLVVLMIVVISCINIRVGSQNQSTNYIVSRKIYVDASFKPEEQAIIRRSLNTLSYETNGILRYDIVFNFQMNDDNNDDPSMYFDKTIIKRLTSKDGLTLYMDSKISEQTDSPAEVYGYDLKKKRFEYILIVADRLTNKDHSMNEKLFQSTVMHEFLHSAAMAHDDDAPSIMNTEFEAIAKALSGLNLKPITCMTIADAVQFCDIYLCKAEELHHC